MADLALEEKIAQLQTRVQELKKENRFFPFLKYLKDPLTVFLAVSPIVGSLALYLTLLAYEVPFFLALPLFGLGALGAGFIADNKMNNIGNFSNRLLKDLSRLFDISLNVEQVAVKSSAARGARGQKPPVYQNASSRRPDAPSGPLKRGVRRRRDHFPSLIMVSRNSRSVCTTMSPDILE